MGIDNTRFLVALLSFLFGFCCIIWVLVFIISFCFYSPSACNLISFGLNWLWITFGHSSSQITNHDTNVVFLLFSPRSLELWWVLRRTTSTAGSTRPWGKVLWVGLILPTKKWGHFPFCSSRMARLQRYHIKRLKRLHLFSCQIAFIFQHIENPFKKIDIFKFTSGIHSEFSK